MRDERTGSCTAGVVHQNRRLDLHEVPAGQEVTDLTQNRRSLVENLAALRVHDEVDISLAVTGIGILQTMEFLRERVERLGEQGELLRVHGDFPCLRLKRKALYADDVADIEALEFRVVLVSEVVAGDIDLNIPIAVENIAEGCFSHDALEHNSARDADRHRLPRDISRIVRLTAERVKFCLDPGTVPGLIECCDPERIAPRGLERLQLFTADLPKLILIDRNVPGCLCIVLLLIVCHDNPLS